MKKLMLVIVAGLVMFSIFGATGFAFAQTQTPPEEASPTESTTGWGMMGRFGQGMMGRFQQGMMGRFGQGMMGRYGQGMMGASGYGPMHEYMEQAFAEALGLTEEELEDKLAAGETMWSIAQAQGLSDQDISGLMLSAREEALEAAVAAGALTQEQADWMQQMHASRMGQGGCPMHAQGARP